MTFSPLIAHLIVCRVGSAPAETITLPLSPTTSRSHYGTGREENEIKGMRSILLPTLYTRVVYTLTIQHSYNHACIFTLRGPARPN